MLSFEEAVITGEMRPSFPFSTMKALMQYWREQFIPSRFDDNRHMNISRNVDIFGYYTYRVIRDVSSRIKNIDFFIGIAENEGSWYMECNGTLFAEGKGFASLAAFENENNSLGLNRAGF